ncbi:MAG: excinuclease ABC subunit UvrC [Oligoflexales bacterium]|nr:excinuclease ABC subunit UvrC [Oligoflexales bacterium]
MSAIFDSDESTREAPSRSHLKEKLKQVPESSGVYLMKDATQKVIYVGKAKNLRNRLRSYLQSTIETPKTYVLVRELEDFDIMLVSHELEALLLERTLIKHHKPRFNVLLRDDKEYPYIRIDWTQAWPRIQTVRRRKEDGALYLGPYSQVASLRISLALMHRIFPLVRCSQHEFANATRPCNYYHIKQCLAPCSLPVDPASYKEMVQDAVDFLNGKNKKLLSSLRKKMHEAASQEQFELASRYRDQWQALAEIQRGQQVIFPETREADVLGVFREGSELVFHFLMIRDGKMITKDSFFSSISIQSEEEALSEFLLQYYEHKEIPSQILLPFSAGEDQTQLEALLRKISQKKVQIQVPHIGDKKKLILMAEKNAEYAFREKQNTTKTPIGLELIRDLLHLDRIPERIECIDISNMQGTAIVSSNVCFLHGKPAKEEYRLYNIKDQGESPDDYAAMKEVLERRLLRASKEGNIPDLLVLDGGRGHLAVGIEVLSRFPELSINLASLAKSRAFYHGDILLERSEERIFRPHVEESIPLEEGSAPYRILVSLRDEAHRFAIEQHRRRRQKNRHSSILDQVPGLGPTLKKRLFQHFLNLEEMKKASLEDFCKIPGMKKTTADALRKFLITQTKDHKNQQILAQNASPDTTIEGSSTISVEKETKPADFEEEASLEEKD